MQAKVYRPVTRAELFPAAYPYELEEQLAARYVEEGMDEDDARGAAKAAVADRQAAAKVTDTINNFNPHEERKRRRSRSA